MDRRTILEQDFLQMRSEYQNSYPGNRELFRQKIRSYLKDKSEEDQNIITQIMISYVDKDISELESINDELGN